MTATIKAQISEPFGSIPGMVLRHAATRPHHPAVVLGDRQLNYAELGAGMQRVAAALQRDGLQPGDTFAICATSSLEYVQAFLGSLLAGGVATPLSGSATPEHLDAMVANAGARWLLRDTAMLHHWPAAAVEGRHEILLDGPGNATARSWHDWLANAPAQPTVVQPATDAPFNLIYSSGTTGVPKGIVHAWQMRWRQVRRAWDAGYRPDSVTLVGTPLYSNTTLVSLLPTLALGATAVVMPRFDALQYLELAERHRATHSMMVPVQYRRLMDHPAFDRFDLSSFQQKFSTGAPFAAELKAEVLRRWPGGLTESYGMTEGGGRCDLLAHLHPHKLHTVGLPAPGHDIRLIDEQGSEAPAGAWGEVVGHSPVMMNGYHGLPEKSREAEWFDAAGKRFIRTGDMGRFDEDGFLVLGDRRKDMIISGGFNIYPSDIEAVLATHPAVHECAVVGMPSRQWGETPVGFVVAREGAAVDAEALRDWVNARVGKTQRLAALHVTDRLPRSEIGKVLKRELAAQAAPITAPG